jgi:hypothetical protein
MEMNLIFSEKWLPKANSHSAVGIDSKENVQLCFTEIQNKVRYESGTQLKLEFLVYTC